MIDNCVKNEFSNLQDEQNSLGVHVVSSSGGHIIAVTNPALALSTAITDHFSVKQEIVSPKLL